MRRSGCGWLLLIVAACSPETVPVAETAGTTTSPEGETSSSSSSSTTETSTDTTESESDDGNTFVPPSEWTTSEGCDPFQQDCPAGEKCVAYSSEGTTWDWNKCVTVGGDGQPGEACTYGGIVEANDDCDASSYCWETQEIDGQLVGICRAFCEGTQDEPLCAEGSACLIANEGSINLCLPTCDPIAQDCPEGLACFWANTDFVCVFTTQGSPTFGDPCDRYECGSGLVCMEADVLPECATSACCAEFCSLAAPACNWVGTECVSLWADEQPPEGYEDVGVCIVPEP